MNSDKIILDLCGGTGAWSKPYKDAGYTVYNLTLPHCDIFDISPLGNTSGYLSFKYDGVSRILNARRVYGILAAPTCKMFSLARTTAKTPRDLAGGFKLVEKCLQIIWFCRAVPDSTLKFWALENPLGYLRQFLGKPALTFSPEDYGDHYTKKTDIWGYFNTPKQNKRKLTEEDKQMSITNNRQLPALPEDYILPKGLTTKEAKRAVTSAYFAEAFYKANK